MSKKVRRIMYVSPFILGSYMKNRQNRSLRIGKLHKEIMKNSLCNWGTDNMDVYVRYIHWVTQLDTYIFLHVNCNYSTIKLNTKRKCTSNGRIGKLFNKLKISVQNKFFCYDHFCFGEYNLVILCIA